MIVQNITEAVIYESPDGGKTVYVRKPGDAVQSRKLAWESDDVKELRKLVEQEELWRNILKAAETNQTLRLALDEVILIYNLSK